MSYDRHPLIATASTSNTRKFKHILSAEQHPEHRLKGALGAAIGAGQLGNLKLLLEQCLPGYDRANSYLPYIAVTFNHIKTVRYLETHGFDVHTSKLICEAAGRGHFEMLQFLRGPNKSFTTTVIDSQALNTAIIENNLDIAEHLIQEDVQASLTPEQQLKAEQSAATSGNIQNLNFLDKLFPGLATRIQNRKDPQMLLFPETTRAWVLDKCLRNLKVSGPASIHKLSIAAKRPRI